MNHHQILAAREMGGAGLVALSLAEHVKRGGQECAMWVAGDGPARAEARRRGLTVHTYDASWALSRNVVAAAIQNWSVGRRLRRLGPGIVHVHSHTVYGALRRGLALSGLARVVHVHLEGDAEGLRWAFQRPPELIITCARFLVDFVRAAVPVEQQAKQRIVAVPNAVDIERFRPGDKNEAKARVGAPAAVPLALMLANLAPHKGQETAIHAVALLKERGVRVSCWMAGVERDGLGAYTRRLQSLIEEVGVQDRVRLVGHRDDAPVLMQAADFLLLPSTCEGLPLSILEAQASRVPVLAAPTAGVPEVIRDGETGFLIAAHDAVGYADRIERLLANPDLLQRVTDAAYVRIVREHNWQSYADRVVELYEELIASGRQAGRRRAM